MLDTIYACASGAGPSAIAVYRLSGIQTDGVLTALGVRKLPETRLASLRRLYHPDNHQIVDEALILRFAAGASYTGEASAELHIHGGPAVRRALEEALELAGARLAEPGEFSRRALLNGRIDVAQAEAVAALVSAEADAQRRQALEILDGAVGVLAQQWRNELVGACALLETGIDFVEEGIEATIRDEAGRRIARLAADLGHHAEAARQASLDVQTPTVALIGRPNAGKSSLLNAILEQDAAIVSSRAGTTRDAVSGDLILNGLRIRVVDTAGMRETDDAVESEGVERAKRVAARADLRILVISHDSGEPTDEMLSLVTEADIVFWTKADVAEPGSGALERFPRSYVVSSRDGSAARAFDAALAAAGFGARSVISPIAGSERRARLVQDAKLAIDRAMGLLRQDGVEAAIEELRLAAGTLERLVGQIDHEDVLDALFSRFCIGK